MNKSHPRNPLRCICYAAFLFVIAGSGAFARTSPADNNTQDEVGRMLGSGRPPRIMHVVVIWLKHRGSVADIITLVRASKSLKSIPGVMGITVGSMAFSKRKRPGVDSSFDVALVMSFKDKKSLDDYTKNPIHLKAVKEVLAPLARKYVIYDFQNLYYSGNKK